MIVPDDILAIAEALRTQDNRSTRDPVFLVQKVCRDLTDDDHSPDGVAFFDPGRADTIDPDHWEEVEAVHQRGDRIAHVGDRRYNLDKLYRYCFKNRWETVQSFLTEQGAKAYLEANGHNIRQYGDARIYVDTLYRNRELVRLREWLMSLHPGATP